MSIFSFARFLRRTLALYALDEGAAAVVDAAAPAAEPAAPAPSPAAAPAVEAPKTMLEAVERSFARDEKGRFAGKEGEQPAEVKPAAEAKPAEVAAAAPKPADPADDGDITKMPEGLGQKAQQRFQALANGIKERDAKLEQASSQIRYVQETFQKHGVSQPQFEQAVAFIGRMNSGDLRGALSVLDEQRRQIALQLGEALPGVDVLAEFPDLKEKVQTLQISEGDAAHIAGLRRQQQMQAQRQQQFEQQRQSQEATQQAFVQGQAAVDAWAKRTAATDIDYPAIEKMLLPKLPAMLEGVPPAQWSRIVQTQYELIKESGAVFRRPDAASSPSPLRPAGGSGGMPKPTTMEEALWGRRLTA